MGLFVNSTSEAEGHGVFGIERTPPAVIQATGTGTVAIIEQFPWGPEGLFTPADMGEFLQTYAPWGMSHVGAGYLALIKKRWPLLKVVRVLGTGAAAATNTISKAAVDPEDDPVPILTLELKYKGVAGNSVTRTVSAASDGDVNHFNLVVEVVNAQGSTRDTLENINVSGTGADFIPSLKSCLLLGKVTKLAAGKPITGTASFATGADGSIAATDYVGTEGLGNKGVACCEGDDAIDFVITGDPGDAFRAVVNSGLSAHANYMGDRFAIVNGDSGQTLAEVQTDVVSFRSLRTVYVDVWAYITDDVDGTERLVGAAPFYASVASQLSPSTSPAWKDPIVTTQMLNGIVRLEASRGKGRTVNEKNGVVTLQKEANGGFSFECAVNTAKPLNPAKGTFKRSRMGHYMVRSAKESLRSFTDAPNVAVIQNDEIVIVSEFLEGLKGNAITDPINKPHIVDFTMQDIKTFNPTNEQQAGKFTIPADVLISADQSQIFFSINYGETVKISVGL